MPVVTGNVEILHHAQMGQDVYIYGIRTYHIYIYIYTYIYIHIYRQFSVFTTSVGRAQRAPITITYIIYENSTVELASVGLAQARPNYCCSGCWYIWKCWLCGTSSKYGPSFIAQFSTNQLALSPGSHARPPNSGDEVKFVL